MDMIGTIESVRGPYKNGWCIIQTTEGDTVTGCLPPSIHQGDTCRFEGEKKKHPVYGEQFNCRTFHIEEPKDKAGIKAYLSRHFSGIGPVMAGKMVDQFDADLFDVIEKTPEKLTQIPGVTPQRARDLQAQFFAARGQQETDLFFATNGVSLLLQKKLTLQYGQDNVVAVVKQNPYALIDDVYGIGFKKADVIAMSVGVEKESPFRIGSGLLYCLQDAARRGHCYLPRFELMGHAVKLLDVRDGSIQDVLNQLVHSSQVIEEKGKFYQNDLHAAEVHVANYLKSLVAAPQTRVIQDLAPEELKDMDADQRRALDLALTSRIAIITGGPGTGKTWTIDKIIRALGGLNIEMAAPTGKAAKRMEEATRMPARTIYRLLKYNPELNTWAFNADNPLDCDVLIVDEASMLDINLAERLLAAVDPHVTQLLLVGDKDQLPSVGPGSVLRDLIESGKIPVAHLKTLHRQDKYSLIHVNAQKINAGGALILKGDDCLEDFWYVAEAEAAKIPNRIKTVLTRIPKKFPFSLNDIQVLCPQKVGPVGTVALNTLLRNDMYNPHGQAIPETNLRVGDRVIQLRNNYDLEIFNGDVGIITDLDPGNGKILIAFKEGPGIRNVEYPLASAGELALAYALTIHKSQGSEFDCCVIPVHTTNYMMLKRNLLYTGITRAKKMVVLVGTMSAIELAISTLDSQERYTNLQGRLVA